MSDKHDRQQRLEADRERRAQTHQQHERQRDGLTLAEGLPPGATLSVSREERIPARTWVKLGADGIEIWLDAEQDARLLVRKVTEPEPCGFLSGLGAWCERERDHEGPHTISIPPLRPA